MTIYRFRVGVKNIGNAIGPIIGPIGLNHACLLLNEDIFEYGSNSEKSYERHKNVGHDNSYDWDALSSLSGKTTVSPDILESYIQNDGNWYSGHYNCLNHNCHDFVKFCLKKIGCKDSMLAKTLYCFRHNDLSVNIRSALGEKNLDVCGKVFKNETNIILYKAHGGFNQTFTMMKNNDNSYSFIIGHLFAIDVKWGEASNGTQIQIWDYNQTNAQKFYLKDENDGYFSIHSAIDYNYVIDVEEGNSNDGTKIQLWEYHGGKNQKFKFI